MEYTPLRKLLKNKIELNPFNDKFQKDSYLYLIFEEIDDQQVKTDKLSEVLRLLPFFNDSYSEFYQYLQKNILNSNITFDELVDLMVVVFNRNFLVVTNQVKGLLKNKDGIDQRSLYSYKVQTIDKSIGKIEAASALESDMDAFNYVINFLRYFQNHPIIIDSNKSAVHPIEIAQRIMLSSNYFSILKNLYDESIWNLGFWKINEELAKPKFELVFDDTELLILNKVGLLRLQRNTSSNFFFAANEIEKRSFYGNIIAQSMRMNLKAKSIKTVRVNDGYISYELKDGFEEVEMYTELKNSVEYSTYYPFLDNLTFKPFENLSLIDLIKLFSLLQALFEEAASLKFDDSIFSIADIKRFPMKISHEIIVNYFLERSTYTKAQVLAFINLVSFPFGERINVWDRPLIYFNESYYVNYLTTLSPIILNLMDYWIEAGGYDLDMRGRLLEHYLQSEIEKVLTEKGFQGEVLKRNKLLNKQKKFEEIDLLIILKSTVLVAEVKCIKYPYEARDKHNSLNRLMQGVKQVKRKKEFIEKYKQDIPEIANKIENKSFVPAIITNFPMYSGYAIDGIPIVDFFLFESYFRAGKMTSGKIERGGNEKTINEVFYYKNENEFNDNLEEFLSHPYPVEELKALFKIINQKISLEKFDYDLFVTSAQIPDEYSAQFTS